MMKRRIHAPTDLEAGFARIRSELGVPAAFPADVLAEAEAARPLSTERRDARDLPLIAIDPPGATDLDQALATVETPAGFRVSYAIADVAAFVAPGGAVDREARRRGTTRYSPDLRTPLHPPVLSEDRASLLPGVDRPALLWTIDLDRDGEVLDARVERAQVRVREAISYAEAQRRIERGNDLLAPLETIGERRAVIEAERGGISLNVPAQEVIETDHGYELRYETSLPVEKWNAQISLLTGMVAGHDTIDAGLGLLRTLPPTRHQDLHILRHQARALGIDWPDDLPYPDLIRTIEPTDAGRAAFLLQAARSFRGAGYLALTDRSPGDRLEAGELDRYEHGAIASVYAHVTAPLRRLVDRFSNEILLAIHAGTHPPTWAVEALDELPSLMGQARSRESALERAVVDYTETVVLSGRVGETFLAYVVDVEPQRAMARLQLVDPAVVTTVEADGLDLGTEVGVILRGVDHDSRTLDFEVTR